MNFLLRKQISIIVKKDDHLFHQSINVFLYLYFLHENLLRELVLIVPNLTSNLPFSTSLFLSPQVDPSIILFSFPRTLDTSQRFGHNFFGLVGKQVCEDFSWTPMLNVFFFSGISIYFFHLIHRLICRRRMFYFQRTWIGKRNQGPFSYYVIFIYFEVLFDVDISLQCKLGF